MSYIIAHYAIMISLTKQTPVSDLNDDRIYFFCYFFVNKLCTKLAKRVNVDVNDPDTFLMMLKKSNVLATYSFLCDALPDIQGCYSTRLMIIL